MDPNFSGGARCGVHHDRAALGTCTRCGTFYCEECRRVGPDGVAYCISCEARAPGGIPWEARRELGLGRAFFETWKESTFSPRVFYSREPREESPLPALLYGLAFYLFIMVINFLLRDLISIGDRQASIRQIQNTPGLEALGWFISDAGSLLMLALSPVIYFVTIFLNAALLFVALKIVSAAGKGYGRVLRTLAYLNGLNPLAIVPFVGPLLFIGVYLPYLVIANARAQQTDPGRVALAVVLLGLVCVGFSCGIAVLLVALMVQAGALLPGR